MSGLIIALVRTRLVDRLVACVAPTIPGSGIGALGISKLAYVASCGPGPVSDGRVEYPGVPPTAVEGEERA